MAINEKLGFAEDYARFRSELESASGTGGNLSHRGLAEALLAVFGELRHGSGPAAVISEAICVYRHWEQADAAEERERDARTRAVRCPSCSAGPGRPCRWPDGRTRPGWHRRRCSAAGRIRGTAC